VFTNTDLNLYTNGSLGIRSCVSGAELSSLIQETYVAASLVY